MAIWQFDVSFVPRGGPMPWRSGDGHDAPPLSATAAVKAHAWLLQHFDGPWAMTEGWLVFGQDQGSRFDFSFDEDGGGNLSARVDVSSNHDSFVAKMCQLAALCECLLFSVEHWVAIEPSIAEVSAAIENSRALKFVKDPRSVLGDDHHGG